MRATWRHGLARTDAEVRNWRAFVAGQTAHRFFRQLAQSANQATGLPPAEVAGAVEHWVDCGGGDREISGMLAFAGQIMGLGPDETAIWLHNTMRELDLEAREAGRS